MVQLKIVKVGNSLGVRLPREVLNRMHLGDGDKLILTEAPEGGYRLGKRARQKGQVLHSSTLLA